MRPQKKGGLVCVDCDADVVPTKPGTFRSVEGWDTARDAGGTNDVKLKVYTGRYLCGACMIRRQSKVNPGRTKLA